MDTPRETARLADGRRDLLPAPAPRRERAGRPRLDDEEDERAPTEQRIARFIRRHRRDEDALAAMLDELPEPLRLTARLVLIRELGAARAATVAARVPGATSSLLAPARGIEAAPTWALDARALYDLARACGVVDVLGVCAIDGALDASLAAALLAGVEPYVARAATSLLRRRDSDGAPLHRGAPDPRGPALVAAAERRAATLYRRATAAAGAPDADDPAVEEALRRRGEGAPLPAAVAAEMEARLGARFAAVRIHVDEVADRAARAVHARAFTVGEDVFFAAGAFAPERPEGRALLAHELTHVAQAQQGRAGAGGAVSRPGDPLEAEAERAERVADDPRQRLVRRMEALFGVSFAGVRLRTDDEAAARAAALSARAYTDGREIGFARGAFAPDTDAGMRVIAHEFAHVAQARGGTGGDARPGADSPSHASPAAEADAHAAAASVAAGERPAVMAARFAVARHEEGQREGSNKRANEVPARGYLLLNPEKQVYFTGDVVVVVASWDASDPYTQKFAAEHPMLDWELSVRGPAKNEKKQTYGTAYSLAIPAPGQYQVSFTASLPDGRNIPLPPRSFAAVDEDAYGKEVFANALVGKDADGHELPFDRKSDGSLAVKPQFKPKTVDEEITFVDLQMGFVRGLGEQKKLDKKSVDNAINYLIKQKLSLLELVDKQGLGKPYVVHGTFVSREDGSSFPVRAYLVQVPQAGDSKKYGVLLHDTTLDPGSPTQHPGEAEAAGGDARARQKAEAKAIDQMVEHWHQYNDFPAGKIRVAIQSLEEPGIVYERVIETSNVKNKIKHALGVVATVAAVATLVLGGEIVLPLIALGAGVGATVMEMWDRREKEGELKWDGRLALDVAMLATMIVGGGQIFKAGSRGFQLVMLAGGSGANAIALTQQTHDAVMRIKAQYEPQIAAASTEQAKRTLERRMLSEIAQVLGAAAANGALIAVTLHQGVKAAGRAEGAAGERPGGGPSEPGKGPQAEAPAEAAPEPASAKPAAPAVKAAGGGGAVGKGKLTAAEAKGLQAVADKFRTVLRVFGSRARGEGRFVDQPETGVGNRPDQRSDIDLVWDPNLPPATVKELQAELRKIGNGAAAAHPDQNRLWEHPEQGEEKGASPEFQSQYIEFAPGVEPRLVRVPHPGDAVASGSGKEKLDFGTGVTRPISSKEAAGIKPGENEQAVTRPDAKPGERGQQPLKSGLKVTEGGKNAVRLPEGETAVFHTHPKDEPPSFADLVTLYKAGLRQKAPGHMEAVRGPSKTWYYGYQGKRAYAYEVSPETGNVPRPLGEEAGFGQDLFDMAREVAENQLQAGEREGTVGMDAKPARERAAEAKSAGQKPAEAKAEARDAPEIAQLKQEMAELQQQQGANREGLQKLKAKMEELDAKNARLQQEVEQARRIPNLQESQKKIAELQQQIRKNRERYGVTRDNRARLLTETDAVGKQIGRVDAQLHPERRGALPCFSPGTPVWTADGPRPIDRLRRGDRLWAFDFERQRSVERTVEEVFVGRTDRFYRVRVGEQVIEATGSHRFWVEERAEWIAAKRLAAGMRIKLLDGRSGAVDGVEVAEGDSATYNLSVEEAHNYFVGPGVLVHNGGEIEYDFGPHEIYEGRNPSFPDRIYIGQTDQGSKTRQAQHRALAVKKLKEPSLSPQDREFYQFMKDVELTPRIKGLSKDLADYFEQTNMDLERQIRGDEKLMNRREQVTEGKHMDELVQRIKQDKAVIEKGYCK